MNFPALVRHTFIAIAVYFMAADFVSHVLLALLAAFLIFFDKLDKIVPNKDELPLIIFILLGYFNMTLGPQRIQFPEQLTSVALIGIYITMKIGRNIPYQSLKTIIFLACSEGLIVLAKFLLSTMPLLIERFSNSEIPRGNILYQERTVGLLPSVASTGLALLIGIILLELFKNQLRKHWVYASYVILFGALACNLSRAAVLAVLTLYGLLIMRASLKYVNKTIPTKYVILLSITALTLSLMYVKKYVILDQQALRILASGRFELLYDAVTFIQENFLFGNNSWRYLNSSFRSPGIHAHNAFLELYATHGIVSLLLIWFIASNLNRKNAPFVLALLTFNLFNFSLFYSFSFGDTLLYALLFMASSIDVSRQPIAR